MKALKDYLVALGLALYYTVIIIALAMFTFAIRLSIYGFWSCIVHLIKLTAKLFKRHE